MEAGPDVPLPVQQTIAHTALEVLGMVIDWEEGQVLSPCQSQEDGV
jgi:hypothetical protein